LAFHNERIIQLLDKRGAAIHAENWKKLAEVNMEIS